MPSHFNTFLKLVFIYKILLDFELLLAKLGLIKAHHPG